MAAPGKAEPTAPGSQISVQADRRPASQEWLALGIRLDLVNGGHVDFCVDSPLWDIRGGEYRSNRRCQVRTVQRIVTLLRDIPDAGITAVTTTDLRRGMTAFAAITALVAIPVITIGVIAVFNS